jgi:hypothetical protein
MIEIENKDYVPEILNGAPVFPYNINWGSEIQIGVSRGGDSSSSGSGDIFYTLGPTPAISYTINSTMTSRQMSWDANGFLNYIRGMGEKFWIKGILDMFDIIEYTGGGGLPFQIKLHADVTVIHLENLEAVWIIDDNGDKHVVKVDSFIEDNEFVSIVTESTSAETIAEMFEALSVRLSSDEVTETYITDSLSEITFNVKELVSSYE